MYEFFAIQRVVFLVRQCLDHIYSLYVHYERCTFQIRTVTLWINAVEKIVYCKTFYECGWPSWTQHVSMHIIRYVRTDFEFYMQLPVYICGVSFHHIASILQEFLAMQRVVSPARLLWNFGAEK